MPAKSSCAHPSTTATGARRALTATPHSQPECLQAAREASCTPQSLRLTA